jgi:hypothetical protein
MTTRNDTLISYLEIFGLLSEAIANKQKQIVITQKIDESLLNNFNDLVAICRGADLEVITQQ